MVHPRASYLVQVAAHKLKYAYHKQPGGECKQHPAEDVRGPVPVILQLLRRVGRPELDEASSRAVQKASEQRQQHAHGYQYHAKHYASHSLHGRPPEGGHSVAAAAWLVVNKQNTHNKQSHDFY